MKEHIHSYIKFQNTINDFNFVLKERTVDMEEA